MFSEIKTVLVMLGFFVAPWLIVGLNLWTLFFVCVSLLLGGFEFLSLKMNGKTLSATFWNFIKENKGKGRAVLGSICVAWVILILHLLGL